MNDEGQDLTTGEAEESVGVPSQLLGLAIDGDVLGMPLRMQSGLVDAAIWVEQQAPAPSAGMLAWLHRHRARLCAGAGHYRKATAALRRAGLGALGADDMPPDVRSRVLHEAANLEMEEGEPEQALILYDAAAEVAALDAEGAPDRLAGFLGDVGRTLNALGRYEEARPVLERALGISLAHHGGDHVDQMMILNALAVATQGQGDPEGAERLLQRALAIHAGAGQEPGSDLVALQHNLATAWHAMGRAKEAEARLLKTLAMIESFGEDAAADLVIICDALAGLYREQGRKAEAARYRRRARRWEKRAG